MFDDKNLQAIFLAGAAVVSLPSSHWLKIALIRLIIDLCFFVYIVCITVVYFCATVVGVAIALVMIAIVCTHKVIAKNLQDAGIEQPKLECYLPAFWSCTVLFIYLVYTKLYPRTQSPGARQAQAGNQPAMPQWTRGIQLLKLEPSHHLMQLSWDVAGTA